MEKVNEESFGVIPLRHTEGKWHVFLILHKHGGHWGFPKGNPDPGETAQESAFRELEEETGLRVEKLLQQNPITESYTFKRAGKQIYKKVTYFLGVVSGALLLQPEEIQEGRWISFPEAFDLLTFEEARRVCSYAQELVEK